MSPELPPLLSAWLRRATRHPMQPRLLLSGSTLIAALCEHARTPNDIDYVVTGEFDAELMARTAHEIVELPDTSPALKCEGTEELFEYTDDFPGLRAFISGRVSTDALQQFLVDFAFGDPLSVPPRAVQVAQVGSVLAVAPESLFAWKVHALVQFGRYAWRPKDVYDLYVMWTEGHLNTRVLPEAIDLAFSSRDTTLDELDDFRTANYWGLETYDTKRWAAFATAYSVTMSFQAIRTELRAALDRLL
jgi:Nucleotidyl transferase AbiEii toxin, Type IV TA system